MYYATKKRRYHTPQLAAITDEPESIISSRAMALFSTDAWGRAAGQARASRS
jgi:hypothetical protein